MTERLRVLHVISGDLWAGAEVQANTLITALSTEADVAVALMNDGVLASKLRTLGIPVNIFDERRLNGLQILLALRRLMVAWRPDIVHTHRTKENILGSLANRFAGNAPCLRTVHGASEDTSRGWRRKLKQALTYADRWCGTHLQQCVVAVSAELAAKLSTRFPNERIVTIENGIDSQDVLARVHPVDFRERTPAATHVGIMGRLMPVKRVDIFLDCAARLRQDEPARNWHFHVFGDGPLRQGLEQQAHRLALNDITTFHGHRDDSIACLAALDALVICSDHEGLPMVLLEALAVGTPVVAHATGGMTDVVEESSHGLLVEEHTASGYARATVSLLESAAAQRRTPSVPERLTAGHNERAFENLYRQLLRPLPAGLEQRQ
jgi:L-malate glycosyltransferase